MNLDGLRPRALRRRSCATAGERAAARLAERWILSRLQARRRRGRRRRSRRSASATRRSAIYHFVWDELCDWYIELAKPRLHQSDELEQDAATAARGTSRRACSRRRSRRRCACCTRSCRSSPRRSGSSCPSRRSCRVADDHAVSRARDAALRRSRRPRREMQLVQEVAVACRMLRATYNVPPAQIVAGRAARRRADAARALRRAAPRADRARGAGHARRSPTSGAPRSPARRKAVVGADVEVVMPLGGLIDVAAEKARIAKEIGKADKEIDGAREEARQRRLPRARARGVVDEQRARLAEEQTRARSGCVEALADARRRRAVSARRLARSTPTRAALLVVDIQERLPPAMPPRRSRAASMRNIAHPDRGRGAARPAGRRQPAVPEGPRRDGAADRGRARARRRGRACTASTSSSSRRAAAPAFARARGAELGRDQWIVDRHGDARLRLPDGARPRRRAAARCTSSPTRCRSRTKANWRIGLDLVERAGRDRHLDRGRRVRPARQRRHRRLQGAVEG